MEDCILHCVEICQETVLKITKHQWETCNEYAVQWISQDEEPFKQIASKIIETSYNDELLCHNKCYKRFCNKLVIQRAISRYTKRREAADIEVSSC